jgi:hypothetical protein
MERHLECKKWPFLHLTELSPPPFGSTSRQIGQTTSALSFAMYMIMIITIECAGLGPALHAHFQQMVFRDFQMYFFGGESLILFGHELLYKAATTIYIDLDLM